MQTHNGCAQTQNRNAPEARSESSRPQSPRRRRGAEWRYAPPTRRMPRPPEPRGRKQEEAQAESGRTRFPWIGQGRLSPRPSCSSAARGEGSGPRLGHGAGRSTLALSPFGTRHCRGNSVSDGCCWQPRDLRAWATRRL